MALYLFFFVQSLQTCLKLSHPLEREGATEESLPVWLVPLSFSLGSNFMKEKFFGILISIPSNPSPSNALIRAPNTIHQLQWIHFNPTWIVYCIWTIFPIQTNNCLLIFIYLPSASVLLFLAHLKGYAHNSTPGPCFLILQLSHSSFIILWSFNNYLFEAPEPYFPNIWYL